MGKNEIDLMVLGVLLGGPAHGYQIKKRIAAAFVDQYPGGPYASISDSIVYPRLSRFEKEGFVKCRLEIQSKAPNKKVYQITESGLEQIEKLTATPVDFGGKVRYTDAQDLIVHVMFFQFITKDERRKVIEPFFAYVKERYEDAKAKLEKFKGQLGPFPLCLLEYGEPTLKNQLDFLQKLMNIDCQTKPLKELYREAIASTMSARHTSS
jgi:PadR family transcriptional regulator AphA